jgi:hypothetical protein
MDIKANGRWAFIAISGLLTLYGAPALASSGSNSGRIVVAQADTKADAAGTTQASGKATRTRHHQRTVSRQKADKVAKSASKQRVDKTSDQADAQPAAMTPAVANANAQMTAGAPIDGAAKSPADGTSQAAAQDAAPVTPAVAQDATSDTATPAVADAPVVASDQLNEVDRAASDDKSPPRILRPGGKSSYVANASAEDAWSQTSLIGKIFIGFGGFLTLASAARMFIA